MKKSFLVLTLGLLCAVYGCSLLPSAPTPATPATVVVPNSGTSWTFLNTYRDSNGTVTKIDTSVRTVIKDSMTIQGFSDVTMTVETFSSTNLSDTIYLRYLSNGDISRLSWPLIAPRLAPEWEEIPYHSHKTLAYAWSGKPIYNGYNNDTISFSSSYTDQENDTVAGTVYPASVIETDIWEDVSGPSKDSLIVLDQTNSFIPSLGIYGNRHAIQHQVKGKQVALEQQVLIAINLK